jgi:hypothetical protein
MTEATTSSVDVDDTGQCTETEGVDMATGERTGRCQRPAGHDGQHTRGIGGGGSATW